MAQRKVAERMEQVVRTYIQGCNDADAKVIAACFRPEAVHFFPPGRAKWVGAATIGSNFARVVQEHGFRWSVDQLLSDVDRYAAAMEWTRINRPRDRLVRGVDWFVFEPQTISIQEVRCYYAAPLHSDMQRQELIDFDYAARGYPTPESGRS